MTAASLHDRCRSQTQRRARRRLRPSELPRPQAGRGGDRRKMRMSRRRSKYSLLWIFETLALDVRERSEPRWVSRGGGGEWLCSLAGASAPWMLGLIWVRDPAGVGGVMVDGSVRVEDSG